MLRKIQQQYQKLCQKQEEEVNQEKEVTLQKASILKRIKQSKLSIMHKILLTYCFFPNFLKSRCLDASLHLANLSYWYYFSKPNNLAFHKLCTQEAPLPVSVLFWA
eukprot:13960545-Ditylum_brightwellii.AAC.1